MFQAAVLITDEPLRMFCEHLRAFGNHIRRQPNAGPKAHVAYALRQPFHAVRKLMVPFPIAESPIEPVVDLHGFEAEGL